MYPRLLFVAIATATGLGINCRGSILCQTIEAPGTELQPIALFVAIVNDHTTSCSSSSSNSDCAPLSDTDIYAAGVHIVCLPLGVVFPGGICAFTEGNIPNRGISGRSVKRKLKQLMEHGCDVCGSVPLAENNDPDEEGILTVNYVARGACEGLCPSTHYN